jgi:hypothetical protein
MKKFDIILDKVKAGEVIVKDDNSVEINTSDPYIIEVTDELKNQGLPQEASAIEGNTILEIADHLPLSGDIMGAVIEWLRQYGINLVPAD